MSSSKPSEIKDYYIAYFDILGYKEFFKNQSDKVPELLNAIHEAIQRTKAQLSIVNLSPILNGMGNIDIHSKVFSDNILLCMEVNNSDYEPVRLLAFIQLVADIQRGFVNEYGLFVRGSILKGKISFNEDYVFGQRLIDAVTMEAEALYPRIIIDEDLCLELSGLSLDLKEKDKNPASADKKENTSGQTPCNRNGMPAFVQGIYNNEVNRLIMKWPDGKQTLNYLGTSETPTLLGEDFKKYAFQYIKDCSEFDYQLLLQPSMDLDGRLRIHKERVEEQLKKYGNYLDIDIGDTLKAELRERILRKYIWVMAFHNLICDCYHKTDFKIFTECNCEPRFLKMTIRVL